MCCLWELEFDLLLLPDHVFRGPIQDSAPRFNSAKVKTMDVSGVVGHFCNRDRGIGGNWMYGVRCG